MIPADASDDYMQQRSFKRRRFTSFDEIMGEDIENNLNQPFAQVQQQPLISKSYSSGKSVNERAKPF